MTESDDSERSLEGQRGYKGGHFIKDGFLRICRWWKDRSKKSD